MITDAAKIRRQELATLNDALTDQPIGHNDKRYFPFHQAPGEPRGADPIADLCATIDMSKTRATCQIFSGFRGSGKSTELHRLAGDLGDRGHTVIFVAGNDVLNLYQPLEPTDLLVSVAAAVATELVNQGASPLAQQSVFARIAGFFQNTQVDLTQIGIGTDPIKFTLSLARNATFKAQVQQALRGRMSEFVEQFQAFMDQAKDLLKSGREGRFPVLIVDDLEKVRGLGKEQDIVQKGMEEIFWSFNWALRVAGWHTIWTAPPYIQLLNPGMGSQFDGSAVLPMVQVWENDKDRSSDAHGINAMRECARLRGDVAGMFLKEELLNRLIVASSGHVRDFMRLLREVVLQAYKQKDPSRPITEPTIDRVIADYVSDYRKAIFGDDVPWLASVAADRRLRLPSEEMLPRVAKLLDMSVVMTYRNEEDWVDLCTPAQGLV
jgi:hypothetical protein